jgi:hypothetical protein
MSYRTQRHVAIAVAVVLAMIGAIQLANAETLGIGPRVSAWLGIVSVGLGILAGFLPSVQGRSRDPSFLADRISELPVHERQVLASTLADRAEQDALITRQPTWLPPDRG